jgi:hypothetical protein
MDGVSNAVVRRAERSECVERESIVVTNAVPAPGPYESTVDPTSEKDVSLIAPAGPWMRLTVEWRGVRSRCERVTG